MSNDPITDRYLLAWVIAGVFVFGGILALGLAMYLTGAR